jgi:hypothetical protein
MCYGVGYNNTTLAKVEYLIEMNSYSTQIAQLQFEYIWIRKNEFRLTWYGIKIMSRWWLIARIMGFTKVEGNINWNGNRINLYRKYSNSHIWIWIIVKWFNKIWKWCYWIACSKTRPLQLESVKNKLSNSNYVQISDLDTFDCTKCMHVSTLKFLDPMMFYMIRGFQWLQIYNFWMGRTKDMNLTS